MWQQAQPVFESALGPTTVWASRTVSIALFGGLVGLPLASITNMTYFSVPATLSGIGVAYSVCLVLWALASSDGGPPVSNVSKDHDYDWKEYELFGNPGKNQIVDVLRSLPSICFGYQCHLSFPLVYASMAKRSPSRVRNVIIVTMIMIATVYITMGFAGALLLRRNTPADILVGVCPTLADGTRTYYNPYYTTKADTDILGCCMNLTNFEATNFPKAPEDPKLLNRCADAVMPGSAIARFSILLSVAVSYGMLSMVVRTSYASLVLGQLTAPGAAPPEPPHRLAHRRPRAEL